MSLNSAEISLVVNRLRPLLEGAEIRDVHESRPGDFVLMLRGGDDSRRLLISTAPKASRINWLSRRVKATKSPGRFLAHLRNALRGRRIEGIGQVRNDRVVEFALRGPDGEKSRLTAELMGPASNLFLLDSGKSIVAMMRKTGSAGREFAIGAPYRPPEGRGAGAATVRDEFSGSDDIVRDVERLYECIREQEDVKEAKEAFLSEMRARRKKIERRRRGIARDLESCSNYEHLSRTAELLKANLASVPRGASSVEVVDYFSPGLEKTVIEINPRLSARGNMKRMFKRAAKRKAALPMIRKRLAAAEGQVERLDAALSAASDADSLEEIAVLKSSVKMPERAPGKKSAAKETTSERKFRSVEGIEILVGRSSRDNDRLTMRVARGNDIWMHSRDRQGSHIILRIPRGGSASLETLLDGANLAVYFSKARRSSKVAVDYTRKKYVRKPKGSPAGYVTYSNNKTLIIDPDAQRLNRLLERE